MDTSLWTWDCLRDCCGQPVTSGLSYHGRQVSISRGGRLSGFPLIRSKTVNDLLARQSINWVLRLRFPQNLRSNRMRHTSIWAGSGGCRRRRSLKSCFQTLPKHGRWTIMELVLSDIYLSQSPTGTQCSSPPPVTAAIRPCTKQTCTADIGRLHGNRSTARCIRA